MLFTSGSQSSSLASMGLSEYETIYEKVSKSAIMGRWIQTQKKEIITEKDDEFEIVENNDSYYSNLSNFMISEMFRHMRNAFEEYSESTNSGQFVDVELLLLDVDDYGHWKILLPDQPVVANFIESGVISSSTMLSPSNDLHVNRHSISESLNGGSMRPLSVRLPDKEELPSILNISNFNRDNFANVRLAVKIFGCVISFFEDSLVYVIEKQNALSILQNLKLTNAFKKFKIPLSSKDSQKTSFDKVVKLIQHYNASAYFDLISVNSIKFVKDVFSIFNSKIVQKEFPPILIQLEKFWNTYYYYRRKHLSSCFNDDDAMLQQEKEEQKQKKKKTHVDIDQLKPWEIPIFEYTLPSEVFKLLKKTKGWKSDIVLIMSYKQLHLLLNSILEVFPEFKEKFAFDFQLLKNFDRTCWFHHYFQIESDPIAKFSHYIITPSKDCIFPEPTCLKSNPYISFYTSCLLQNPLTDFTQLRNSIPKTESIRVLSLDGGGIKGLNLISICEVIEQKLGKKMCEIFDLICGTSTGAILAKLFQMGYSCEQCKTVYHCLGKQIFKLEGNVNVTKTILTMQGKSWYDEKTLEHFFKKYVGKDYINSDPNKRPLCNPYEQEFYEDLMMHAESSPFIFRSYSDPFRYAENKKRHPDFYLGTLHGRGIKNYQALRCTSAAPLYFKEMAIGQRVFVDGAVVANNPSVAAAFESKQIWPDHEKFVFISVGTGLKKSQENTITSAQLNDEEELKFKTETPVMKKSSSGLFDNVKKTLSSITDLLNLQLSSEKQHKLMLTQVEQMRETKQVSYFRFNTPNLGDFDLDIVDDSILKEWEQQCKKYIADLKEMDDACEVLKQ
ncbi:hypothetical protein FDP41_003875 [Naegleria fowleri]|uniref:PNPLA domain-containing protein n=1 Tax=Naegleria fowleri TaxID=5763 RepID=A0A6A5BR76_NAEFO|nr:uncharacterized protein FDP41_003875 [Naegleria fowleri]KAF0977222.1 hypothetical protein FDP41_003875 [Naegleria fowleri]